MDPLTLPALAVLVTLKGLPGFGVHKVEAVAVDSLPPAWRPVSELVLENTYVTARLPEIVEERTGLRIPSDPRTLRVSVDATTGTLSAGAMVQTVPVGPPLRIPLDFYAQDLSERTFERLWQKRSIDAINTRAASASASGYGQGLSFRLPSPLPKRVQSLLGPGGPAINVAGSENIRLSGQSNWTNRQIGPLGQKRSLFPSLDMQQDLDIRLEGQLSDRIKVNLLQNSANQIPLANRIFINYRGDEDDLVQSLDLGNTSLSLPGTQYVSYSGKNEGLFGIKTALKLGPADLTLLASKQEGRSERSSYSGGATQEEQTINDYDYIRGVYYFLYDPNVIPSWLTPSQVSQYAGLNIEDNSIKLYLDDGNYANDIAIVRGKALVNPEIRGCAPFDTAAVRGSFTLLNPGANDDYEILRDVYGPYFKVLKLRRQLSFDQRLGVAYVAQAVDASGAPLGAPVEVGGQIEMDSLGCVLGPDTTRALRLKLLRAPRSALTEAKDSTNAGLNRFDPNNPFTRTRELELKNFYPLPGQRIDPSSFQLSIRRGYEQPYQYSIPQPDGSTVSYLEILGLDSKDEGTGTAQPGHDDRVDGTLPFGSSRTFVDFENGVLFFPDLRPFAPRLDAQSFPFDANLISPQLLRRVTLTGTGEEANAANPFLYDRYNPIRADDSRYFIDVKLSAARAVGDISLGRSNILEGSEVVTINGQALTRDRDYTIDYDIGRVSLKRQLGPADQLNINYSYAPLFAQAGRTLIGSDFRIEGRDKRFGGALLYESRGAQDLRPRIGEEPSRSVIADVNTEWTFHPDWMTRMVDALPGVRTTTASDFHFQAEMGASFPNPNTKNIVYLDDMESVKDAVSVPMTAERWSWSSVPSAIRGGIATPMTSLPGNHDAEINWYSPPSAVKEHDLNPSLDQARGGENSRQVLALSVPRRPTKGNVPVTDSLWVGLTYPLDLVGLDLSRSQFIEVWVNDFNDHHLNKANPEPRVRGRHLQLHIDLGVVSEDQMRSPDSLPNRSLDTEDDQPPDNTLSVTNGKNEDTGLDRLLDGSEPGSGSTNPQDWRDLTTASATDPEGDDWTKVHEEFKENVDTRRFRGTNGTEGNRNLKPYPDTEDLNLNNNLDTVESYFEYTVDLGDPDSPYLHAGSGIDVLRDYRGSPYADSLNGWRRYRIPLTDSLREVVGSPDLTIARHVRVWLQGIIDPDPSDAEARALNQPIRPLLMLGGLEIVGSRWQVSALDSIGRASGTTVTLNAVNNLDDRGYTPPFDPGDALSGNQSAVRREQSLVVEVNQLQPGSQVEAYKTFSIDENYSRYGNLTWYAQGRQINTGSDSLYYFVRFSSDELGRSYYEFRRPLTSANVNSFEPIDLALTALSGLKLNPDFPIADPIRYSAPGPRAGDSLIINGRPSFTRLRRISVGIGNAATTQSLSHGELWFDELRATNIAKDVGKAGRLQVDGRLANLFRYSVNYNQRDADFVTVGETRGSGNRSAQLGVNGGIDLNRFFEATAINLPVNAGYSRSSSKPRFTAGDDVIRSGALQDASETKSETRNISASYSRNWSDRSNPLLRYTMGGITANTSYSETDGHTPTSLTSGFSRSSSVNYAIAPRNLLQLRVPGTKIGVFPLPERAFWNYSTSTSSNRVLDRQRDGTILPRSDIVARSAYITFGADTRPVDLLHHHFDATRNLTLRDAPLDRIGFINLGRVVTWKQNFDSRLTMNRGPWMSPGFNWSSSYDQDNRPELSPDLSVRAVRNGQSMGMNWSLPFDRLATPKRAANDTTPKPASLGRTTRGLLSRLGNVSADANYSQSSSYSRLTGTPDLFYLAGLHRNPGFSSTPGDGVQAAFGNGFGLSSNFRTSGRARIALGFDAFVSTRAEYSTSKNNNNDVRTRNVGTRFPDLDFEYGRVAQVIRLNRFMDNPVLRTSYNRTVSTDYRESDQDPSLRTTSSLWQPLLGLSGQLKNQTRAELRVERRVTVRENYQTTVSVSTERNTDVNLNLSRSYSKGQKVVVLGRESTVRSNVNLSLAVSYSKKSGETRQVRTGITQLPVSTDRLSVNGNGSYSFSSNVTGNLGIGYTQNHDFEKGSVDRGIRLELRAAFTF